MPANTLLPVVVGISIFILFAGLLMKRFRQPLVIGYILAGLLIGPHGVQLIQNETVIGLLGELGVMLLLFFAGLELSFPKLLNNWRIAIVGTILQVILSISAMWLIGLLLHWNVPTRILLGFVISLSSTALVLKLLEDRKKLQSRVGQNVIGILLIQDIAVIFMILALNFVRGDQISVGSVLSQISASILVLAAFTYLAVHKGAPKIFARLARGDPDIQVFAALLFCFGLAFFTQLLGLSSALGSFLAGMILAGTPGTAWVHEHLHPLRVLFVALFFSSIGMLIQPAFLWQNLEIILIVVSIVLLLKTVLNAAILRVFGERWRDSFYSGALLSQIGEFSFVLAAVAVQSAIIGERSHQLIVSVICMSLVLTPLWISLIERLTGQGAVRKAG